MGWTPPNIFVGESNVFADKIYENWESLSYKISGDILGSDFGPGPDPLIFAQDIDLAHGNVKNVGNIPTNLIDAATKGMSFDNGTATRDAIEDSIEQAHEEHKDGGGIVWLSPGIWRLSVDSAITLSRGVEVRGAGPGATVFLLEGHPSSPIFELIGQTNIPSQFGPRLSGISIVNQETESPGPAAGILVNGWNCRLEDIICIGFTRSGASQAGFVFNNATGGVFNNLQASGLDLEDLRGTGFRIQGGESNQFNRLGTSHHEVGMVIDDEIGSRFMGCWARDIGVTGIKASGIVHCMFLGCSASHCRFGFDLKGADVSAVGCTAGDNEFDDFILDMEVRGRIQCCTSEGGYEPLVPRIQYYGSANVKNACIMIGNRARGVVTLVGEFYPISHIFNNWFEHVEG
jgi:hypothetical protein